MTARRFGIGTSSITLYPIGGVARLNRIPRSPGAELLITIAGPAVNFAIAGTLIGLASLGAFGGELLGPFVRGLIVFNIGVALFNMVPAFPMDGGRIFRALLSTMVGRLRATQIAAGLGRVIAVLFGIYCLANSIWMGVFIALFIFIAGGAELASVAAEEERRRHELDPSAVTVAPEGFQWVQGPGGRWKAVPITVESHYGARSQWP